MADEEVMPVGGWGDGQPTPTTPAQRAGWEQPQVPPPGQGVPSREQVLAEGTPQTVAGGQPPQANEHGMVPDHRVPVVATAPQQSVQGMQAMPVNPELPPERDEQVLAQALDGAGYESLQRGPEAGEQPVRKVAVGQPAVIRVHVYQSGLRQFQIVVPPDDKRRPTWQPEQQDSEPWWTLEELDGVDLLDMGLASTDEASDYDRLKGVQTMLYNCVPIDDTERFRRHLKARRFSMAEVTAIIEAIGEAIAGIPS